MAETPSSFPPLPSWNMQSLHQERGKILHDEHVKLEAQEEAFKANFIEASEKIAISIAAQFFKAIHDHRTNPYQEPLNEISMSIPFLPDFYGHSCHDDKIHLVERAVAQLSPFNEWSTNRHYYSEQRIGQTTKAKEKFGLLRAEASRLLTRIFTAFLASPENAGVSIEPSTDEHTFMENHYVNVILSLKCTINPTADVKGATRLTPSLTPNLTAVLPKWIIKSLREERELAIERRKLKLKAHEEGFAQNYKEAARKIAEKFTTIVYDSIAKRDLNSHLPYPTKQNPQRISLPFLIEPYKNKDNLVAHSCSSIFPFNEWIKDIHYWEYQELSGNKEFLERFFLLRKETVKILGEIFTVFMAQPQNSTARLLVLDDDSKLTFDSKRKTVFSHIYVDFWEELIEPEPPSVQVSNVEEKETKKIELEKEVYSELPNT